MNNLVARLNRPITKWQQRIGYGMTDFACNLIWQVVSLYLLYFYTDVMKLHPAHVSIMFVITRIIDGLNDFVIGYIIDKTNTKFGKSRPYFLIGAIPLAIFSFLCFYVPSFSYNGRLIYAYITYIGLCIAYTLVNIPMASIVPSLTSNTNERTMLTTSRKFFGFLGATVVSSSALGLVNLLGDTEQEGFGRMMLLFGIVGLIIFIISFVNVREVNIYENHEHVSIKQIIQSLSKNKPWKIFAVNIMFMWTGFFIQSSALVYYFGYVIGDASLTVIVATMMSMIPMIVNFFVPFLANHLGKKRLFIYSSIVQLIGILIMWFASTNYQFILVGAGVSAAGYGLKESIYFSMQADPVDYGEAKTGINATGSISAINSFLGQVAQAIAGGVAAALLALGNYNGEADIQPEAALIAIESMYIFIPLILIVLSIFTMSRYNLTEDVMLKIKQEKLD